MFLAITSAIIVLFIVLGVWGNRDARRKQAEGDALAEQGLRYFWGDGVEWDMDRAVELCKRASELGTINDDAQVIGGFREIEGDSKLKERYDQAIGSCCMVLFKAGYKLHFSLIWKWGGGTRSAGIWVRDAMGKDLGNIHFFTCQLRSPYTSSVGYGYTMRHVERGWKRGGPDVLKHVIYLDGPGIEVTSETSRWEAPPDWLVLCAAVLELHYDISYPEWVSEYPEAREYVNAAFERTKGRIEAEMGRFDAKLRSNAHIADGGTHASLGDRDDDLPPFRAAAFTEGVEPANDMVLGETGIDAITSPHTANAPSATKNLVITAVKERGKLNIIVGVIVAICVVVATAFIVYRVQGGHGIFPTIVAQGRGLVTDPRDRQTYRIVKIENLVWMAKNLNYKTDNSWCYDNSESNCMAYGRLYAWSAAVAACPKGWHLPSRAEWNNLVEAAGGDFAGTNLAASAGWYNDGNGTDGLGFSALPGGNRQSDGSFSFVGAGGYWWSATVSGASDAYYRGMGYDLDNVRENYSGKNYGFSVRCVQDTRAQTGRAQATTTGGYNNSSIDVDISRRLLTDDDLRGLSKEQLRILRNTVFARYGYKFQSEDLQRYFGTQSWYHPRYDDVTHLLNEYERKNVWFIKKHE